MEFLPKTFVFGVWVCVDVRCEVCGRGCDFAECVSFLFLLLSLLFWKKQQQQQNKNKNKFDKNLGSCGMRPNADCLITNIVGQNGYCFVFSRLFLVGQKVNNNESVLEISFQQQKLTRRHNCCNIGLYWYKNISHRAAETVINLIII